MTTLHPLLPATELEALAARALVAGGMRTEDAAEAARILVLADLLGIPAHGVARIPDYLERLKAGGIDPLARPRIERVAGALMRVDGSKGLGPLVASRALHAAMQAAHGAGIAAAFVRGSSDFGAVMPYCFIAARHGFASIIASNAPASVAPRGANPLGIGVPRPGGDPVILDMAMGVAAGVALQAAAIGALPVLVGAEMDAPAPPPVDAMAVACGAVAAMGGHKGHGLAVMMDLLAGVLSGAGFLTGLAAGADEPGVPEDLGHVLIVIDTTRLGLAETLAGRIDAFRAVLHGAPGENPAIPERLPGEASLLHHRRRLEQGVPVAETDLARLREIAG